MGKLPMGQGCPCWLADYWEMAGLLPLSVPGGVHRVLLVLARSLLISWWVTIFKDHSVNARLP